MPGAPHAAIGDRYPHHGGNGRILRVARDAQTSRKHRERSVIKRRDVLLAITALATGLGRTPLHAQDYPNRPITIIVPAAAGSPSDFPARLASQILPPRLGQPVVVEYRPGAAGAIG